MIGFEFAHLVANGLPLLLVDVDRARIACASPAAHQLFGFLDGELHGQSIHALVPAAIQNQHVAFVLDYARNPRSITLCGRRVKGARRDGSEFDCEIGIEPVHSGHRLYAVVQVLACLHCET